MNYKYNNIAILGLGVTGQSVYSYFSRFNSNIVVWDDKEEVRKHYQNKALGIVHYQDWDYTKLDIIFISPGVILEHPKEHLVLTEAKKFNIPLICDVEAFLDYHSNISTIGLTGTNGKSTTLRLIEHIFTHNLLDKIDEKAKAPLVGGNIGVPILYQSLALINKITHQEVVDFLGSPSGYSIVNFLDRDKVNILELSSYQLDLMHNHHLHCALMLNIQPDHLDHHGTFANYIMAKKRIFLNQTSSDYAIINQNCLALCQDAIVDQKLIIIHNDFVTKGIYIKNNRLYDNYFSDNKDVFDFKELHYLNGEHNYYNIAFAYAVAKIYQIDELKIIEYILSFKGVNHRQTLVEDFNDIKFINDSKATNPESTYYALSAFNNIALILGGLRKRDELDILLPLLKSKVLKVFLIGNRRTNSKSIEIFKNILEENNINYEISYILHKAVYDAYEFLKQQKLDNKTLLLSPACASMDQFKNFEHRGDRFVKIVKKLISSKQEGR